MTDRFKTRPKSVTSGLQRASVSTNNLHFSVVKSTDSQWKPNNGGMWVADASNLLGGKLICIAQPGDPLCSTVFATYCWCFFIDGLFSTCVTRAR